MTTTYSKSGTAVTVIRWLGRITGALLVLMVLAFAIGEGPPNLSHASLVLTLQTLAFVMTLAGLVVGWFRDGIGGALAIAGLAAFYVINFAACGRFPGGAFPLFAIPGLLLLTSYLLGKKKECGDGLGGPA